MAKNGLFLNYVSEKMLRERTRESDGAKFFSVGFAVPETVSVGGKANFTVNVKQVYTATKKDGTVKDGFKNVLLGQAESKHKVSVKGADGAWTETEMTSAEILKYYEDDRAAYRAAQKAANTAEA